MKWLIRIVAVIIAFCLLLAITGRGVLVFEWTEWRQSATGASNRYLECKYFIGWRFQTVEYVHSKSTRTIDGQIIAADHCAFIAHPIDLQAARSP